VTPASERRSTLTIAFGCCIGSLSVTLWWPFLPLFLQQLGAQSDAEAAFWMAAAMIGSGVSRILGGPIWGVLADRVGRKNMFLRGLFAAGVITLCSAAVSAPWQLIITMTLFGFFSGFNAAAIALASVTVPDARLKTTLSMVSGGQYVGQALGPAIGAVLALVVGYRGTMLASGLALIAVAMVVARRIPADQIKREPAPAANGGGDTADAAKLQAFRMTTQLAVAITVYGILFALNGYRSVSTSMALKEIDPSDVIVHTGMAFALTGVASALGVLLVSADALRKMRLRSVMVGATLLSAATYLLLALSDTVGYFVMALTLSALLNAAMFPATNTLIAMNVARARRGTAFGLATSAQAVGNMAGPLAAALFTATSLQLGFVVIGGLMAMLAVLIALVVKEPVAEKAAVN